MEQSLKTIGEFGLISLFENAAKPQHAWVDTGIGDDCAVIKLSEDERLLVTTDMLLDRVHFLKNSLTPFQLGYKAMAVNISDIAAMGGIPKAAFLALGLTADLDSQYVCAFRDGLFSCAKEFQVDLLGGDTVLAKTDLTLSLTLLGTASSQQVVYRNGAKPQDCLLVGGFLGDSAAGLQLLLQNKTLPQKEIQSYLLDAHLRPKPQVSLGRMLATNGLANAMIDISDGLLQDLSHICKRSAVGAVVEENSLPISAASRVASQAFQPVEVINWALSGGEDYVLLFCVSPDHVAKCHQLAKQQLNTTLHQIGYVTKEPGLWILKQGQLQLVTPLGYDAFR